VACEYRGRKVGSTLRRTDRETDWRYADIVDQYHDDENLCWYHLLKKIARRLSTTEIKLQEACVN
jgi:hypothetical protein